MYSICYLELCDAPGRVWFEGKLLYHLVCRGFMLPDWVYDEQHLCHSPIHEKIRIYRIRNGLQQQELAERAGISRHAVMRYENGLTKPTLEILYVIADVLGIKVDKLYDGYYAFLAYPYSAKMKEIRKANKLLQRELATMLGVGTKAVADWEQGKSVALKKTWEKLLELELL